MSYQDNLTIWQVDLNSVAHKDDNGQVGVDAGYCVQFNSAIGLCNEYLSVKN